VIKDRETTKSRASRMKKLLQRFLNPWGKTGRRKHAEHISASDRAILDRVRPFTMTSTARLLALIDAVRYVSRNRIAGAIAECGVWRGGSMMAVALTLRAEGDCARTLYLYDTFQGMTAPTSGDIDYAGVSADTHLGAQRAGSRWCAAGLDDVRDNLRSTGYPFENLRLIAGKVEDTIPAQPCGPLALLRLDTDWYESTRHELLHLFPLLVPNGVLILDDYGHWQGARQATDEYFAARGRAPLLQRIDYSGRLLIKTELA
jgi:hypothetical protein